VEHGGPPALRLFFACALASPPIFPFLPVPGCRRNLANLAFKKASALQAVPILFQPLSVMIDQATSEALSLASGFFSP